MASPANFQCSRPTCNFQISLRPKYLSVPLLFRDLAKSTPIRFPAIRASSSSPSNPKPSLLKTTCISLTAAAALFSASFYLVSKPAAVTPVVALEATLEKHLEKHSNDVKALFWLTKIKIESDKHEKAINILNRLIEIEPDEQKWPAMKARILSYHSKSELAIAAFEEILAKDPTRVDAYHYLVMEYCSSKPKLTELETRIHEAIRRCKKEKKAKEIRDLRMLIAQIRVIEGNSAEAIRICEEIVKDDPDDFTIYLFQGAVYTLMNRGEEAAKQFQQVARVIPKNYPYISTTMNTTESEWRVIMTYDNVYCYLSTFARLAIASLFEKFG